MSNEENKDDMGQKLLNDVYELLGNGSGNTPKANWTKLIDEYCKNNEITENQLSDILSIKRPSLRRIMEGEAQKIDVITLIKLCNLLGEDPMDFIKQYIASLSPEDIAAIERPRKVAFILENFDLKSLKAGGFILSTKDFDAIEARICEFFGLSSVFEYANVAFATPLYSKAGYRERNNMKMFWVKSAIMSFRHMDKKEYDPDALDMLLLNMRSCISDREYGFYKVVKALYQVGVNVIVQPYLGGTSVHGATFIVDGKPCIAITDCGKRYDRLWFSLIHELSHVIQDMDQLKKLNYHVTDESAQDIFLLEERANRFAREYLLSDQEFKFASNSIYRTDVIEQFAKEIDIDPSIIYGRYLFEKKDRKEYQKYQKHIPSSDMAVSHVKINSFTEKTIEAVSKKVEDINNRQAK